MLATLIKKQFYQCFSGYFIDSKTGKAKSKTKVILTFVLFGVLMLFLCFAFVAMAYSMEILLDTEFRWLYYSIFGIITISLGTFASAFNTANSIYNSKDNNLLLSMPIKPAYILLSRVSLVYGLSLLYSFVAWIPGCLFVLFRDGFNFITLIIDILLLFITSLLVSVISCGVGYVIAFITNKTKNKSLVNVLISGVFIVVYYLVCFRFSNIMESVLQNSDKLAKGISTWANFIYQLGNAANGSILSFIIYTLICVVLAIICYYILSKSFAKIVTKANNVTITTSKITYKANKKTSSILFKKELKRFISSPTYMLNCGLGVLFVLGIAVFALIKGKELLPLLDLFKNEIPELYSFLPLGIVGVICMIISINAIAVPSIALEGKNLWIIKSLPVKTYEILDAKKMLQMIINGIPAIIASAIIGYALKLDFSLLLYVVVLTLMFVEVQSSICVLLSLVNPNFNWSSETQPIKQSMNVLIEMVVSWILTVVIVAGYYLVKDKMLVGDYMQYAVMILVIVEVLLRRVIRSWGVNKFESL